MPAVTVFLLPGNEAEVAATVRSVRQQTFDDWEGVALAAQGGDAHAESGRWRVAAGPGGALETLNAELDACRGEYVMVLEAGATLRPGALGALVRAAANGADGAYGGYRFVSRLGELPNHAGDADGVLGEPEWARAKAAPLAAMLTRRERLRGERFDASLEDAAGWEWCLRLARGGVSWRGVGEAVVDIPVRPPTGAKEVLSAIRRHRRVGACVGAVRGIGGDGGEGTNEALGALAEAERRIVELVQLLATPNVLMNAGRASPWRYAQWWHRLGLLGEGPSHLLSERSGPAPERLVITRERRPVDIFVASYQRPDRLTAMIESVRGTGYPAHICVAAGDIETIRVCERYVGLVECVYSTEANRRTGCTAPLNHVVRSLVRHDAIFCTDDCLFAPDAIDVAMGSLDAAYPDGDGVVGLAQENIPEGYQLAFPLIGRKFRERFTSRGELFFPGYYHMYNDGELGLTIQCLGRWHFEPRANVRHFHPCTGVPEDETHARGRTHIGADVEMWHRRRVQGLVWGIDG